MSEGEESLFRPSSPLPKVNLRESSRWLALSVTRNSKMRQIGREKAE